MIHQYGYGGIAGVLVLGIVGLPLPDETLLTLVGYMIYRGYLSFFPAIGAGIFGASAGITLSYLIGARLGRPAVLRFGRFFRITDREISRSQDMIRKYGGFVLFVALFIPGVRHVAAIGAGLGGMGFARFAFPAYLGVFVWVTLFITLGRFAGPRIDEARMAFPGHTAVWFGVSGLAVLALGVWAGLRIFRIRR